MDIDICSLDVLKDKNLGKICFVPLAWNFYDEIKQRIKNVRKSSNDVFIRYFPTYTEDK